jgi:hypothetical protein
MHFSLGFWDEFGKPETNGIIMSDANPIGIIH